MVNDVTINSPIGKHIIDNHGLIYRIKVTFVSPIRESEKIFYTVLAI